ncbi:MAG: hypothetical protein QGF78_05850 [Candidatus Bathyarchaeota archaeon]|nr:hypothetical protein [Candidatus Bathyarchaeota archaeon]
MEAFDIDIDPYYPNGGGKSRRVLGTLIKIPNIIMEMRTLTDYDLLALEVIFGG